jgi:LysR family cys regulon transcriptional activator
MNEQSPLKQFYYKRNRLQQLKGFYYTAQEGSVTKAAKKMRLNQSTITLQIQTLERDLGAALFIKNARPMKLSKDGELLYEMASEHLKAIDGLYEEFLLRKKGDNKLSKINIAVHHIAASYLLPKYIKEFSEKYPEVTIGIKNIDSQDALKRLQDDELDLIIYPNLEISNQFFAKTFCNFDPILIMKSDHPLTKKKEINLKDISKYNIVRIDKKLITLPLFEQIFTKYKFKTNIEFENGNWEMVKHYVKAGIGVGFVSTVCLEENDKDLAYRKLNQFFPTAMDYQIIIKKGKYFNKILSEFVKIMDSDFPVNCKEVLDYYKS